MLPSPLFVIIGVILIGVIIVLITTKRLPLHKGCVLTTLNSIMPCNMITQIEIYIIRWENRLCQET